MSSDATADRFKQAFVEEAREILVDLEAALLELNERPDDAELIARAFRALHTIKGSGAMFGFEALAQFVHKIENAYDEVRNGRLRVTEELVNLSLAAFDQIKAMLNQEAAAGSSCDDILQQLSELTATSAKTAPAPESTGQRLPPLPVATGLPPLPDEAAARHDWRIHFAPGPDFMRAGADPLLLLRELQTLGSLQATARVEAIPGLQELDPERCYLSWDLVLNTAAERDVISDVFIFVADCCALKIEGGTESSECSCPAAADSEAGLSPGFASGPASVASYSPPAAPPVPTIKPETTSVAISPDAAAPPKESKPKYPSYGRRGTDTPDNATSIRVPAAKLDQFVNLVGELVTVQARLGEIAARRDDAEVVGIAEEVERLTTALRENSISIRMLPIRGTFERFRRLVHDLARDLRKEVELAIEGADTELDKSVIDELNDPLMHLIRNSMDHGIEPPDTRAAAGKPRGATLRLSARYSGASVLIDVSDDGAGISQDAVRRRAIEKGLVAADAVLTEKEIFSLILAPGFSTARQITDVSGRGVGMDVVRRKVEALRGGIEIASQPGAGSSVTLRLPLTLAIIDGLLVRVDDAYFVLPLASTLECIELSRQDIEQANGKHVVIVRGQIIPYLRLREYFHMPGDRPEREQVLIAETEDGLFGFVIDEVLGDHQTVIKNLGRFYRQVQMVSGATILGNGIVALILDPHRLVRDALRAVSESSSQDRGQSPRMRSPGSAMAEKFSQAKIIGA